MAIAEHLDVHKPQLSSCSLCGSKTRKMFSATDQNHKVSNELFEYFQCLVCRCVFIESPPADLSRYYLSGYYAIPELEQLRKVADKDRNKIDTVLRFKTSGRLLEVGPAFGVFAWQAKQAGFVVDVIEMDSRCCEYLHGTLGVNVTQTDNPPVAMQTLPQNDVIAIWHVLEHLPDALAFLRAAKDNLATGGVLVIAMPNPDAWQFKVMGRYWPHLDAPRHLTLIPASWIIRQAAELGMEKLYLTTDDSDARSWNRFGWQRLLMNRVSSKLLQRVMFVMGYLISLAVAPFDRKDFSGSSYTIVLKKK